MAKINNEVAEKIEREQHGNGTFTADKWEKLLNLLRADVKIGNALSFLRIPESTYLLWLKNYPDLVGQVEEAKVFLDIAASNNIAAAISNGKSMKDSWEYKKRRDERFSDKAEITGAGGGPIIGEVTINIKRAGHTEPKQDS